MSPKIRKLLLVLSLIAGLGLWTPGVPAQTNKPGTSTPFTFISWGDSRSNTSGTPNTPVLIDLSHQAAALNPAFTMFAGDLCDGFDTTCASDSTSGWKYALDGGDTNTNTLFNITFPFRGNHDGDETLWDTYFGSNPAGGRAGIVSAIGGGNFSSYSGDSPERTYSFDFGNSHFVGIDMPRGGISSMTRGRIMWLDQDLTDAEARGVTHSFIMDHGPIYFVDGHRSNPSRLLVSVLNNHPSISATFHGHEHVMAHVHIDSAHVRGITHEFEEFVTGAAGAPLYTCDTSRLIGSTDYCEGANNGFMSVTVDGNTVTVDLYFENQSPFVEEWQFTNPSTVSPLQ